MKHRRCFANCVEVTVRSILPTSSTESTTASPAPFIGYNPDDKLFVGFSGLYTRFGFQKEPFASQHEYNVLRSLSTGGTSISYEGNFIDVFGRWDFQFEFDYQGLI